MQGAPPQGGQPHLSTKEHEVQPLSPYTALATLVLFKQRRLNIGEEMYDQCVDTIVGLLEEVNDEKFRLIPRNDSVTPES